MSVTFNWNTVLSSFDERGTLLKQLKSMEDTFEAAGMTGCEVVDPTDTSLKLKFTFADGSSLTTSAIDIKGAQGDPATVAVGTTTTLSPGSNATVTNSGTDSDAVLNFGIPKGEKGDTGEPGGVTTFGGQNGAITIGAGLTMSGKQVSSHDFNLVDTGMVDNTDYTYTGAITAASSGIRYALNSDKSIGKIYGTITATIGTITQTTLSSIKTGIHVAVPSSAYDIAVGEFYRHSDMTAGANGLFIGIASDGEISIKLNALASASGKTLLISLPACLYFFKDFGDTPDNRALPLRMAVLDPIEEPQDR